MKKNSSKKARLLTCLASIICPLLVCFFTYSAIKIYPSTDYKEVLYPIIFSIIGLIGGYLIHNALHELGHALFAKKANCHIFEIAFCGFVFSRGRVRFKPSSVYAGWTSFVPKDPEDSLKALLHSLYGGFLGSIICLLAGTLSLVLMGRSWLTLTLVCSAQMVFIYMTVINFSSGADGTDGKLLASSKDEISPYFESRLYILEAQSRMFNGLSAKEMGEFCFSSILEERPATYIDLLVALESGEKELAKDLISQIENGEEIDDNGLIASLCEKLFLFCVENDVENADALYKQICGKIDEPCGDLTAMRALYAYKALTGENEWASALSSTFKKACDDHPLRGYGKTQLNILDLYFPA